MNCTIFVTVRIASTRLPRKALLKIGNKPLIKILLERVKTCKNAKRIVVCTTTQKSDDKLVEFLKRNTIDVFRGDNKDVLNRLYLAAKKYAVNEFVVVEGDDLFCEPALIDQTCRQLAKSDYDFIVWKNLPFGVSPIGIKTKPREMLVKNKATKDTETGWGRFIEESGFFKVGKLSPRNRRLYRPEIRLSVDYMEDFQLVKKILNNLPSRFALKDIIEILDKNPDWLKINESVKKIYEQNFAKKMTKIEFKNRKI